MEDVRFARGWTGSLQEDLKRTLPPRKLPGLRPQCLGLSLQLLRLKLQCFVLSGNLLLAGGQFVVLGLQLRVGGRKGLAATH